LSDQTTNTAKKQQKHIHCTNNGIATRMSLSRGRAKALLMRRFCWLGLLLGLGGTGMVVVIVMVVSHLLWFMNTVAVLV
jgi:hypothetical protein